MMTDPAQTVDEKTMRSQVQKEAREQRRAEALRANLVKRKQWQQAQMTALKTETSLADPDSIDQSYSIKG